MGLRYHLNLEYRSRKIMANQIGPNDNDQVKIVDVVNWWAAFKSF